MLYRLLNIITLNIYGHIETKLGIILMYTFMQGYIKLSLGYKWHVVLTLWPTIA